MATLTLRNRSNEVIAEPMARFDQASAIRDGGTRYTLRSDGKILRQFRHEGKLEAPKICATWKPEVWRRFNKAAQLAGFRRYAAKRGVSAITIL